MRAHNNQIKELEIIGQVTFKNGVLDFGALALRFCFLVAVEFARMNRLQVNRGVLAHFFRFPRVGEGRNRLFDITFWRRHIVPLILIKRAAQTLKKYVIFKFERREGRKKWNHFEVLKVARQSGPSRKNVSLNYLIISLERKAKQRIKKLPLLFRRKWAERRCRPLCSKHCN